MSAMTQTLTAACVQNCATGDVADNLARLEALIAEAAAAGATFIALPEACEFLSGDREEMRRHARPVAESVAFQRLSRIAADKGVWLLIGSLTVRDQSDAMVNRSLLVAPDGSLVAHYDKIHMFDANVPGQKDSRESDLYEPGKAARMADLAGIPFGFSICYDVRFPHLYRSLAKAGAQIIGAPAAFTKMTGEAHWHVLLRARAIENGCFIVAPGQWGNPYGERQSYGRSLIIDPWGRVLADAGEGEGIAVATLDLDEIARARNIIMSLDHDRPFDGPDVGEAG